MTAPLVSIIPHGDDGHFESRACTDCRRFLDELARLDKQMLELCAHGLAEVVSTDHRGERSYRLTPRGIEWVEWIDAQKTRCDGDR